MWLKRHKDFLSMVTAIVVIYSFMFAAGISCPIKFITGVSCPGCGMTRAWISLLKLNFSDAFYYHPLFPAPPVLLIIYLKKSSINSIIYRIIMLTAVVLFIIVYLYRLFLTEGPIVVFEPGSNILFRLLKSL